MKNLYKLIGNLTRARSAKVPLVIIALVTVIGFSFTACDDGSGGGSTDGKNGGSTDGKGGGTFTLTGIPSQYNGKYAIFNEYGGEHLINEYYEDKDIFVFGCESLNLSTETFTACLISNGSVSLPMWIVTISSTSVTRLSGNYTCDLAFVFIMNTQQPIDPYSVAVVGVYFESIEFLNGSAARTCSQDEIFTRDEMYP